MEFTYAGYRHLIQLLREHGYTITDYHHWQGVSHPCILRHDVDNSLERAVAFAELEAEMGVHSTYFLLLTSEFYNVFSLASRRYIRRILQSGHEIGIHFDETAYEDVDEKNMASHIQKEIKFLCRGGACDTVSVVSMHRPSAQTLEADLKIPGIINSYGKTFFREFKYLSDSRRCWREDVWSCVENETYDKLHILTHAVWYNEKEIGLKESLVQYIRNAAKERYWMLDDNFTNLQEVLREDEI